jgi:hypothetical protein
MPDKKVIEPREFGLGSVLFRFGGCAVMSGGPMLIVAALLLPSETMAQTVRAAVDCSSKRLGLAERETCASPELARLTARVDDLTARLERELTGRDREALVDTEAPFVKQRNHCQNTRSGVHMCVERVLRHRLDALSAAATSPAAILAETTRYTYLDVPYLLKWGRGLVGRRVGVWGCMTLAPGPTPASRIHGTIRDCPAGPGARSLPAVFKSMSQTRATWFYDAKKPAAYWEGTVEWREGRLVLAEIEP